MIAANLPDVDVLAFATGIPPVALRRGWTHVVLAQPSPSTIRRLRRGRPMASALSGSAPLVPGPFSGSEHRRPFPTSHPDGLAEQLGASGI